MCVCVCVRPVHSPSLLAGCDASVSHAGVALRHPDRSACEEGSFQVRGAELGESEPRPHPRPPSRVSSEPQCCPTWPLMPGFTPGRPGVGGVAWVCLLVRVTPSFLVPVSVWPCEDAVKPSSPCVLMTPRIPEIFPQAAGCCVISCVTVPFCLELRLLALKAFSVLFNALCATFTMTTSFLAASVSVAPF